MLLDKDRFRRGGRRQITLVEMVHGEIMENLTILWPRNGTIRGIRLHVLVDKKKDPSCQEDKKKESIIIASDVKDKYKKKHNEDRSLIVWTPPLPDEFLINLDPLVEDKSNRILNISIRSAVCLSIRDCFI